MKKIADISKWQGEVDWGKAAEELDFAILRASCGQDILDTQYLRNVDGCITNGVPFGAYHYVKAGTAEEARAEARFFVQCTEQAPKKPIFYIADIEYEAQTKETTEAVCVAFLEVLRSFGLEKIGMYINTRYKWAGAAIGMCDIMWIPHWGADDGNIPADSSKPDHPHDIWQYTSKGKLAGVNGYVDLNLITDSKPLQYFTDEADNALPSTKPTQEGSTTMFTNLEFVAYCLAVYAAKWVYWYGTCGYKCSTSLYNSKSKQYPAHYTSARASGYKADIANGKMCADCVGLIKSFFWLGGKIDGTNKYGSNGCPDTSANGMIALCKEKGPISTMPDIPGLVVHKPGHIGVYVGGGYTIELNGFATDCIRRKVKDGPWTQWGKLPATMLSYVDGEIPQPITYKLGDRTLQNGDEGSDVVELQTALKALGYDLGTYGASNDGVDGEFGSKTQTAVMSVQTAAGIPSTGVFDTATYKALLNSQTPTTEPPVVTPPDPEPDTPNGGSAPAYVLILEGDEATLRAIKGDHGGTLAAVDSVLVQ